MLRVEVVNYRTLQRELKVADVAVQKNLNKSLKVMAPEVAAVARADASWSQKIPPQIVPMATTTGAGIRVKRKPNPLAVLNERPGGFRHPLFGNRDHWYTQKTKPAVRPAVVAAKPKFVEAANLAVDVAFHEAGFY